MSFQTISLLTPTRKRLPYLQRMLASYEASVDGGHRPELIFRCDSDDLPSVVFLTSRGYKVIAGPRLEGYKSLPVFFNEMAAISSGDILMGGNDDMVFSTKGWPELILAEANKYPDGIFNIGVNTGLNDDLFPFWIVSRLFYQKLGKVNDERLLFTDVWLRDVMNHFGRAIRLTSVSNLHDWAGHHGDETRHDAELHEKAMVFINQQGDWTPQYRELHDNVVRETISALEPGNDTLPSRLINEFEAYTPPTTAGKNWPPRAVPREWGHLCSPTSIHYGRNETAALLRIIFNAGIDRDNILLSSYNNGLPTVLWGTVFRKVATMIEQPQAQQVVSDGKYTIAVGPITDRRFQHAVDKAVGPLNALLLDQDRYCTLMSTYYYFRRRLSTPGVVIFVKFPSPHPEWSGATDLLLAGLRNGGVDGECHDIRDVSPSDGAGFAYELLN